METWQILLSPTNPTSPCGDDYVSIKLWNYHILKTGNFFRVLGFRVGNKISWNYHILKNDNFFRVLGLETKSHLGK
jgi:hypothetical protein